MGEYSYKKVHVRFLVIGNILQAILKLQEDGEMHKLKVSMFKSVDFENF